MPDRTASVRVIYPVSIHPQWSVGNHLVNVAATGNAPDALLHRQNGSELVVFDHVVRMVTNQNVVSKPTHLVEELDVTDKHIVLSSRRHGRVQMRRSAVRSFRQLDNPALVYDGPTGRAGWKTLSPARRISEWKANTDGQLSTAPP